MTKATGPPGGRESAAGDGTHDGAVDEGFSKRPEPKDSPPAGRKQFLANLENTPAELRERRQWICWKLSRGNGRTTKPPTDPTTGLPHDAHDSFTWHSFDEAVRLAQASVHADGVGYVFAESDPYCGIDLDGCIDTFGQLHPEADALLRRLDSYVEVSPSGTGVHCILRARHDGPGRKTKNEHGTGGLEVYGHTRFFTMTGRRLQAFPASIGDRQQQHDELMAQWFPSPKPTPDPFAASPESAASIPLNELRISPTDKYLIREGAPVGKRSDALWHVWCELYRAGYARDEIAAITYNAANGISQKCREKGRSWQHSQLEKAWLEVERERNAGQQDSGVQVQVLGEGGGDGAQAERPILLPARDFVLNARAPVFVIDGIKEIDTFGIEHGPPGSGKSAHALYEAVCIALGLSLHGRIVKRGPVVYVIGEGGGGIARRLRAIETLHGISLMNAPFVISRCAVPLLDAQQAIKLRDEIKALAESWGASPVSIFIDTTARNFGDGDENSNRDMGRFVANVDRFLREPFSACVTALHHPGHQEQQRARGASALIGAIDFDYALTINKQEGIITYQVGTKRPKDFPPPAPMHFRLEAVQLNLAGQYATSVAVKPAEGYRPDSKAESLTENETAAHKALGGAEAGLSWSEWERSSRLGKSSLSRAKEKLAERKLVTQDDEGRYRLTAAGLQQLRATDSNEAQPLW